MTREEFKKAVFGITEGKGWMYNNDDKEII